MILVIGSTGIVSTAIQNQFTNEIIQVVAGETTKNWISNNTENSIYKFINTLPKRPSIIVNCTGITDSTMPTKLLMDVNFHLPKKLLELCQNEKIRLVTFGSVMENNRILCDSNPYLKSKREFFNYFKETTKTSDNHLHLQLHTLYGGKKLHRHMFLGQMFEAIINGLDFKMTEGNQLREYHHVMDDMQAVHEIFNAEKFGVIEVSHEEKLSLKLIAQHVFSEFGIIDRLKIGQLPNPIIEQYTLGPSENHHWIVKSFRPTLPGITDNLREFLRIQK